jgi:O-antigen/teichoic acid export membrane protein
MGQPSAAVASGGSERRSGLNAIVWRNTVSIGATRIGSVALDGLTYILTARYFGPAEYGQYLSLLAFLNLVDLASDMTVMDITVREISKEPEEAGRWLVAGTLLRLTLAMVGVAAFAGYFYFTRRPAELLGSAVLAALCLPMGALRTPLALFRARMKMHYELGIVLATRALNLALFAGLMYFRGRMSQFFLAILVSRGLLAVLAWAATFTIFGVALTRARGCVRRLIHAAAPMGLSGLFVATQFKADILMLARVAGAAAAGLYGAVAQLPEYSLYLPVIISTPVLPVLSRLFAESEPEEFQRVYGRMVHSIALLAMPVAIPVILLPQSVVSLIFGAKYASVAPVLPLVMLSMVAIWISHATAITAVATGLQGHFIWIQSICVAIYLGLNWLLLPRGGIMAAGAVRLLTTVIAPILTHVVVRKAAGFRFPSRALLQTVVAGLAMGAVILALARFPLPVACAAGFLAYVSALWGTSRLAGSGGRGEHGCYRS